MIEKERKKERMLRAWECALLGPRAHLRYFKAKGGNRAPVSISRTLVILLASQGYSRSAPSFPSLPGAIVFVFETTDAPD